MGRAEADAWAESSDSYFLAVPQHRAGKRLPSGCGYLNGLEWEALNASKMAFAFLDAEDTERDPAYAERP